MFEYGEALFSVFHANKGEGLPRHEHMFKHATICNAGSCVIRKEGKEKVIDKHTQPIGRYDTVNVKTNSRASSIYPTPRTNLLASV